MALKPRFSSLCYCFGLRLNLAMLQPGDTLSWRCLTLATPSLGDASSGQSIDFLLWTPRVVALYVDFDLTVDFDFGQRPRSGRYTKIKTEEDEHTIFLRNLDKNTKIQPVDFAKQLIENLQQDDLPKEWKIPRDLSFDNIIGQIKKGVSTRRSMANYCNHTTYVSKVEPNSILDALKDEHWTTTMHEELNQFVRNDVWSLVPNVEPSGVQALKNPNPFEGC